MEISINSLPQDLKEISVQEFNVKAINSIKDKYKGKRSASKAPTFALT